jgi:hypothetical protein
VEAAVLSIVDPSLKVSIAVYCCVPVIGTEAVTGVTLKDTDVAGVAAPKPEPGVPAPLTPRTEEPPPHPVTKIVNSNVISHITGLKPANKSPPFGNRAEWQTLPPLTLSNLFIFFS